MIIIKKQGTQTEQFQLINQLMLNQAEDSARKYTNKGLPHIGL